MKCFIIFVLYIWTKLLNVESWKQSLVRALFSHTTPPHPAPPRLLGDVGKEFSINSLCGQFKEKKKNQNMPHQENTELWDLAQLNSFFP